MNRWFDSDKYELAELATYSRTDDPRHMNVPWKVYGGIPDESNPRAIDYYNNNHDGQFGAAVFEDVLLDFQPDIVVTWHDGFMISYMDRSPFRNKFKWVIMSMIDSKNHPIEDLQVYQKCDVFLPVTRFSKELIEEECSSIKMGEIIRPGVNTDQFIPLDDKERIRQYLGIPIDANVIVSCMRNQGRKLFPQLMQAFKEYLEKYEDPNCYLYLHTSYPDVGFDLCNHVLKELIGHRVLFTYRCGACKLFYADNFSTELSVCKRCGQLASYLPGTSNGVTREELCYIFNAADLGVQYASSEGLCMPTLEMRSCGLPVFLPDFAAMSEQAEIEGFEKIDILHEYYEPIVQTGQLRCIPDNRDLVDKIHKFFSTSKEQRKEWGLRARQDAIENWSFDQAAKKFEKVFDELEVYDRQSTWSKPTPTFAPLSMNLPQTALNNEFVDWCFDNILGEPERKHSYWRHELIKGLNCGLISSKGGQQKMDKTIVVNTLMNLARRKNYWEQQRMSKIKPKDPNTIQWRLI